MEKAGGLPVLLPPLNLGGIDDYVRGLAGVILAGGGEIDATLYGAASEDRVEAPQPHRDRFELALARAAVQADLPLLAIGRGMHILNVAQGGTLIPWLPAVVDHDRHASTGRTHVIQISVSSKLGKAVGDRAEVAAPHHQAVKRLGTNLLAVAWATTRSSRASSSRGTASASACSGTPSAVRTTGSSRRSDRRLSPPALTFRPIRPRPASDPARRLSRPSAQRPSGPGSPVRHAPDPAAPAGLLLVASPAPAPSCPKVPTMRDLRE